MSTEQTGKRLGENGTDGRGEARQSQVSLMFAYSVAMLMILLRCVPAAVQRPGDTNRSCNQQRVDEKLISVQCKEEYRSQESVIKE